jgi:hypothetical protein
MKYLSVCLIALISLFFFVFCPIQSHATMPTPSNVQITGCVIDRSFLLFKKADNVFTGMEKYELRSYTKDPFDYDFLNGKLLRTTAAVMDMRRKQISLRDSNPEPAGSCLPVSVNGCVVDGKLFVIETIFGDNVIKHSLFNRSGYIPRPAAISTDNGAGYDL